MISFSLVLFALIILCESRKSSSSSGDKIPIYVVSFPKSGRTWLRLMIGYVLDKHFDLQASQEDILELSPLVDIARRRRVKDFPPIAVDHAKKQLELVPREKWRFPEQFVGSSLILLVRDPRDVFVSNWYEKKYRKMGLNRKENDGEGFTASQASSKTADCSWFQQINSLIKQGNGLKVYLSKFEFQREPYCNVTTGTCSCFHPDYTMYDFMREPQGGFDTICYFSEFFYNNRNQTADFHLVRYEDLHAQPLATLRNVMSFLRVNADTAVLEYAIKQASFESMREKELAGTFGWRLTARNKNDPATFKTRQGKVGEYVNHFDVKTLQMMEQQVKQTLHTISIIFYLQYAAGLRCVLFCQQRLVTRPKTSNRSANSIFRTVRDKIINEMTSASNSQSSSSNIEIREVKAEEFELAAKVIAKAFSEESVMYKYIFQNKDTLVADLSWFFWVRLAMLRDLGGQVIGVFENNELRGCLSIGTIEAQTPSLWTKLRHGLLLFPIYFGFDTLNRATAVGDEFTRISKQCNGDVDVEIMMVVTDPAYQNKGFGKRLMTETMRIVREKGYKSAGLGTQLQKNVDFYKKFGFKISGQPLYQSITPPANGWVMKCDLE